MPLHIPLHMHMHQLTYRLHSASLRRQSLNIADCLRLGGGLCVWGLTCGLCVWVRGSGEVEEVKESGFVFQNQNGNKYSPLISPGWNHHFWWHMLFYSARLVFIRIQVYGCECERHGMKMKPTTAIECSTSWVFISVGIHIASYRRECVCICVCVCVVCECMNIPSEYKL